MEPTEVGTGYAPQLIDTKNPEPSSHEEQPKVRRVRIHEGYFLFFSLRLGGVAFESSREATYSSPTEN